MDQRHNWFLFASGVKKLQYRKNPEMYSQLRQNYKFKYSLDARFRAMAHSVSMGTRHNTIVPLLQHEYPANSAPKYYVYA